MEEELNSVKGPGGVSAGFFKPMNLPENMATTSAEVIAGLNEHLVTVLQVNFPDGFHLTLTRLSFSVLAVSVGILLQTLYHVV